MPIRRYRIEAPVEVYRSSKTCLPREVRQVIAAIISPDRSLRSRLEAALEAGGDIESVVIIPEYPGPSDICSLESMNQRLVAFIDFRENPARAIALAGEIQRSCPSVST